MVAPFPRDNGVHESGKFLSECWRTWWKVNLEFVGPCVKRGEEQRGTAGPHGKTGKRGAITGLVLPTGIVKGEAEVSRCHQAQLCCTEDSASLC